MTSPTLDYAQWPPFLRRRKVRIAAGIIVLVVGWSLIPSIIDFRERNFIMDEITGSMRIETKWFGGLIANFENRPTAIKDRLQKMGATWTPSWRGFHSVKTSLSGGRGYSCGTAPRIYSYRVAIDDWASASSDAEILAFVNVMQTGNDDQQIAALEALGDKGLANGGRAARLK